MTDPATKYAQDVRDGKIVAGRLVRQACLRHLTDLEQAEARGFKWKPDEAQAVIEFFETVLCLPEDTDSDDEAEDETAIPAEAAQGKPFILSGWERFIVGSLFGWYAKRTSKKGTVRYSRRFRVAYVETGKGSGKTPLGAGILLYLLVADGVRGAQIFCAAVSKDQAKLAFTDAERMAKASPDLSDLIDFKLNNLSVPETGSFLRPISSEKRGLDGKRVQGASIDELHEHQTHVVAQKMRAGTKGRRNALIFVPTNAGYDRESICWYYHEYSREVLDGTTKNEAWFAYVCGLDPCAKCAEAGQRQPTDGCRSCDRWDVEGPHWLKANPNLGVSIPWQYLREQVREAIGMPTQRNIVKRLNFCEWTDQVTIWIPTEKWRACRSPITPESLRGQPCFIGIDLSDYIDLTSAQLEFKRPKTLAAARQVDLGPDATASDGRKTYPLNFDLEVLSYFWMPKAVMAQRAEEDKIDYPRWEKDGYLFTTAGSQIDLDAIFDAVVKWSEMFQVVGIGIDPSKAGHLYTRLAAHFGETLVTKVQQGFRTLSEPCKVIEALVMSGGLRHDGNDCMAWNVANAAKEENNWGDIRPVKVNQRKRIDGLMALVTGMHVLTRTPEKAAGVQMFVAGGRR